ncbi:hypothetical protein CBR_g55627 [Chara braunii]|uniref:RNA-directed DNA polymerase n=1 Tax=Chara braunii TaxID=69332 RepID=A0A388MD36_CHABU|nr:hypothetical protein CBR_g55627 [Chara braunii]|eukprot:GBG92476.1 hypothetical protein CBR_g55627 [Chara braunii]
MGTSSGRREATRRRSPEYERRDTIADRHRDDWRENLRDSYWRDRDRDRAPPRRVFDPQTGESHPLPYESKDRYIITHKASEPPTFRGYGITEYLKKWELHACRSQWSEEEIIENFLFNVDPSLGREVKEARPKDGKWTTYKKSLVEIYKLEDNKYSIKDLETMTQDEDESVRAFGMRFQKISDVLMKKGKISEVERCTIFIGHLSKGMEPVRSQSIKITFEGDMATTPIRVAATKSARGSTSKKTHMDYVVAEKDGQWVDGEEVILSPRKRGVKKFLMKSSLDEIDTVEPLRRALRQPMQCSILAYLAASKPARDELQMITWKTRIPLSEEGQGAPKAEASTVAVTGVTARADRMATVLLDGMEGVPPDKFYILGSGAVETIINDGAVLDAVIDNGSKAVIIDEDLAVQVGLGLDRSYLFEIETADGRKQQITGVCHKAAIEVQGVRVTLPVFAVKNCSSDLLLGRTWLSHVHAVTIERPDGSQTLSIKKPDGTRVMIETVEPRDPRNRAALAVGARPSDQIKSLPISSRAVRFREKKYGPLLTEEEGQVVEVEDLGSRLIVDGNSYPKEKDEEFGGVKEKEKVIAFLKEKMISHVAEPSDSAYANRWLFLRKPNGKIRWIQDLQKVNAVTIRDVGSVPHADLLAEGTTGRSIYSVCDLFSGYDEVPLDPRDRYLTAMHTPLGLIQMMVVPMGWTNGITVFQRAMVAVLKDFIPDKVEVFLDDFPIKGPVDREETEVVPGVRRFVEQHLTDICAVLEQLDDANLTVSGTKSRWAVSTIKILDFICDSRGRRADPAKLDKLLNWLSLLHSPTEVRQFLGVVGYWRIFIRGYEEKADPLRLRLRKTEKFYWDSSKELAMQELKAEFKEGGRVLGVPFFDDETKRPFIVSTDVGPCSVGGLLSQKDAGGKERPLRFESRTLNTAERNYSQFKKEVLAVLRCLDTFRHYTYGRRFILRVDPTAVASVLQKDFSLTDPTIARWLIRIRLYDYTVERVSGTKNVVADGLSRIPLERPIVAGALTMPEPRRAEGFLVNLYEGKYRMIGLHLTGEESQDSEIRRQAAQYCLRAGHLFRRPVASGMPLRVACDPEERQTIVAELHDGVVGGHRGVKGTYEKIRRLYWWEGQYKDVERYYMTCEECQKRALVKYKEPLHPSYPTRPGEKVHIDLVKMPRGVGNITYETISLGS